MQYSVTTDCNGNQKLWKQDSSFIKLKLTHNFLLVETSKPHHSNWCDVYFGVDS